MSSLSDLRIELVEALNGAGLAAETHVPGGIDPPIVLVFPSDPYVERGDTLKPDVFQVNYDLILFADTASNARNTEALDEMITAALFAVMGDWHLVGVGQPDIYTSNQSNFLGTIVQVQTMIQLSGTGL